MATPTKKKPRTTKSTKKPAAKQQTYRDQPRVPTSRQIEESIRRGTSVSLEHFVKGVKL